MSKVQSYFLSLSRANTVQLPSCDLDPTGRNESQRGLEWAFDWGCFGLNDAQIASGEAEADISQQV